MNFKFHFNSLNADITANQLFDILMMSIYRHADDKCNEGVVQRDALQLLKYSLRLLSPEACTELYNYAFQIVLPSNLSIPLLAHYEILLEGCQPTADKPHLRKIVLAPINSAHVVAKHLIQADVKFAAIRQLSPDQRPDQVHAVITEDEASVTTGSLQDWL